MVPAVTPWLRAMICAASTMNGRFSMRVSSGMTRPLHSGTHPMHVLGLLLLPSLMGKYMRIITKSKHVGYFLATVSTLDKTGRG